MGYEIDREDIILLLLDSHQRVHGQRAFNGITRLEKLIFLLIKEKALAKADELFGFKAYKFGPFSKDVYEATEFLHGLRFIDIGERPLISFSATTEEDLLTDETSGDELASVTAREKIYSLTDDGKTIAEKLRGIWQQELPSDLAKIDDVVQRFASLSLNQIIRYVYRRFPDMAANSIHPEAERLSPA